jgi:hypothetical protein
VQYFREGGSATADELKILVRKQQVQVLYGELNTLAISVAIKILQHFHCAAKYFTEFTLICDF